MNLSQKNRVSITKDITPLRCEGISFPGKGPQDTAPGCVFLCQGDKRVRGTVSLSLSFPAIVAKRNIRLTTEQGKQEGEEAKLVTYSTVLKVRSS